MKTGLSKRQKKTEITFDEQSPLITVHTHNAGLKRRLLAYSCRHPQLCRLAGDDGQGGLSFEVRKGRFSFRLTAPYSDERRKAASDYAKKYGISAGRAEKPGGAA